MPTSRGYVRVQWDNVYKMPNTMNGTLLTYMLLFKNLLSTHVLGSRHVMVNNINYEG